jgi:hypothetical protein
MEDDAPCQDAKYQPGFIIIIVIWQRNASGFKVEGVPHGGQRGVGECVMLRVWCLARERSLAMTGGSHRDILDRYERLDLYLLTYFNMVGETRQVAVSDVGSRCEGVWAAVGIGRSGGPLAGPAFELCRAERF